MDAEELKRIQAPLKARYKEDPSAALVTLRAAGHVVQKTVSFVLDTGKPGVPVGLHPAAGGDGSAACSGDMLLEALVGCAGVTLAAVATAMGIELSRTTVAAEGELDFRGTLGVSREAPVGFSQIRLLFTIETQAAADKVQKLVELSERYCVILQTLSQPPKIQTRILPSST
jgi:uncharacterized OsmC-like protein